MKKKFIVTADNHLDPIYQAGKSGMRGDSREGLLAVFEYARRDQTPVILAGDVLDKSNGGSVSYGLKVLAEAQATGIKAGYIVGNHDQTDLYAGTEQPAWLSHVPGLVHLSTATAPEFAGVLGIDYTNDPEALAIALESARARTDVEVLVLHGSWDAVTPSMHAMFTTEALDGIAPIVVIGDTHVQYQKQTEKTLFISPGATVRQRRSDLLLDAVGRAISGTVGWAVLSYEVSEAGHVSAATVQVVPVPDRSQRAFYAFDIQTPADVVRACSVIKADATVRAPELDAPYVLLRVANDVPAKQHVLAEIPAAFVEAIRYEVSLADVTPDKTKLNQANAQQDQITRELAVIAAFCENETDPRVQPLLREILHGASSPAETLTHAVNGIFDGTTQKG